MSPGVLLLLLNAASTFALTGLIWTIQLVHYPAFQYIDELRFVEFESFHQRRIGWVIAPLMLVELSTTAALFIWRPSGLPLNFAAAGVLLVIAIWICTFALQAPLHNHLSQGYDRATIGVLASGNWIRTLLWTLRACLLFWALCAAWPLSERAT